MTLPEDAGKARDEDPVEALAALLEALAESKGDDPRSVAARAAQIARRLDREAAEELWTVARSTSSAGAGRLVPGILRGVAEAARIDGVSSTGVSPASIVNVHAESASSAVATSTASALTFVSGLLDNPELPDDARPEAEALRHAIQAGDREDALERWSALAGKVAAFPVLAKSLIEIAKVFF